MADLQGITVKSVYAEALGMNNIEATIYDIDEDDMLEVISIEKVIEHYGADSLLEEIGKDAVIEYFKIEEKE